MMESDDAELPSLGELSPLLTLCPLSPSQARERRTAADSELGEGAC